MATFDHERAHMAANLVSDPLCRVRVSGNAFIKDWVRVRVGIRLEG